MPPVCFPFNHPFRPNRGRRAAYLDGDAAAPLLGLPEHGGEQGGLPTAHVAHHRHQGAARHADVDPVDSQEEEYISVSEGGHPSEDPSQVPLNTLKLLFFLHALPFETRRALSRPAEGTVIY